MGSSVESFDFPDLFGGNECTPYGIRTKSGEMVLIRAPTLTVSLPGVNFHCLAASCDV